ncbi:hypothetical protein [Nocardia terpenica]|uniref:Uncharacterized protein n=1 Tax=Nocardia terpenica TaxID=455432 RepID=A0A164LN41_9NOCA|nr:hypothetical protein [Nocardia terpenica]KZM72591.1 hypothetical protein AWN90_27725 [Nocardia terpenica]MBF6059393.1 hypothetical protein [Nocardia terpenica]MBF6103068.1 hypothetical protein [Nocardia terpenica]MBF6110743.1 hypothetical protein [Nocardia terpenica]MBF6116874.1 hypothetical protein [Nocardia terpenica]
MQSSAESRDLVATRYASCRVDPGPMPTDHARIVLSLHAGHGPGCSQYLAALRSISTLLD